MLSQTTILEAMQYDRFNLSNPLNTAQAPAYTITYQYAGSSAPPDLPTNSSYSGWQALQQAEKEQFEAALAHIESFLNVTFSETHNATDPDLNVATVDLPGSVIGNGGYSVNYSGATLTSWDGFVAFDNSLDLSSPDWMSLLLHELGHAMGLCHPFEGASAYDSNLYTVMSYQPNPINGVDSDAMMLFDVFALLNIWGAASYNDGETRYTGCRTNTVDSVWDSGGIDTFDAADRTHSVRLDLREGAFSSFDSAQDVVITFGTKIENAYGAQANDSLIGNSLNNHLHGRAGKDYLSGRSGDDRLQGGSGRDHLRGGSGEDRLIGGRHGDRLFGGTGDDTLIGNSGWDRLDGQRGDDRLVGGRGRDTFIFRNDGGADTIADFTSGTDRLKIVGYGTLDDLLNAADDTADGVLFDFGNGDSLLLVDVTLASLGDDFIF